MTNRIAAIPIQVTVAVTRPFIFIKPSVLISKASMTAPYNRKLPSQLIWKHTRIVKILCFKEAFLPFCCCLSIMLKPINEIIKDELVPSKLSIHFFYGIVVTGLTREYLLGIGYNHGTIFMSVQLIIKRRFLKPGIEIPPVSS